MSFKDFSGATVVVTGHTGFKGSWLTAWLKNLGANVVGISLDPMTSPSHFDLLNLKNKIVDLRMDLRDLPNLKNAICDHKPDFLFHLAAQSLVKNSYENPLETWQTNLIGTVNVLESLRFLNKICSSVIITSDKCYRNVEWEWGYRETDELGGSDPYSASKGAAELAIRSYVMSYFSDSKNNCPRIVSARAGNVIGGGDWSADRIIPDCVKAWTSKSPVLLRNPLSTRPWQHVLEPLSGYLWLALKLSKKNNLHGESFNFGPPSVETQSVEELVKTMAMFWDKVSWCSSQTNDDHIHEAGLLKLNCDKASHVLSWSSSLSFIDTVKFTAEWYKNFYDNSVPISDFTNSQINTYTEISRSSGRKWACQF
jgi:CDP-glucose 4,6-dehydratase